MISPTDSQTNIATLCWPELIEGRLINRYKRFLADIRLDDGSIITAHCPNSGRMTGCCEPGRAVYVSRQDSPKRKLKYTWELIEMPDSLVGVNTLVPNRLVHESVRGKMVAGLAGYDHVRREVRAGDRTRFDLMLTGEKMPPCYVEIKNCTLVVDRIAYFPDAVTSRGKNHLMELEKLAARGCRCVMFYLVQRMDADLFKPADLIDPSYGKQLRQAVQNGIEIIVCDVDIDLTGIRIRRNIPYTL